MISTQSATGPTAPSVAVLRYSLRGALRLHLAASA